MADTQPAPPGVEEAQANRLRTEIDLSETRGKLYALSSADEPDQSEIDKAMTEYRARSSRHQAALLGAAAAQEEAKATPAKQSQADKGELEERQDRKLLELRDKVRIADYFTAAASDSRIAGAAKEYNQARGIGIDGPTLLPIEMLAPAPEVEHRADAATSVTGNHRIQATPLRRMYSDSVAAFLGVRFDSVPMGTRSYPVMTGGANARMRNKGQSQDAQAAAFSFFDLAPIRLAVRYLFAIEDVATFPMLEETLRDDLRRQIINEVDEEVIRGDGTSPNVTGIITDLANPANPTARASTDLLDVAAGLVDGVYAQQLSDVSIVLGSTSYQELATTLATNTSDTALDMAMKRGIRVRVSDHIQAAASNVQTGIAYGMDPGAAVAPVWEAVTMVRDPYSAAAEGRVALTAIMLWNFKLIRENAYSRFEIFTN